MNIALIGWVVAIVLALFMLNRFLLTSDKKYDANGTPWKVYGTMECGWTRKQIDELKKKGVPHKFMDCSKGMCEGEDVSGMPTNILPDGSRKVGFTSVN
jgi:hypothetical protein